MPERDIDKPFLMPIEDVFSISGRGTVVTGRVERGKVKVGEEIEIVGFTPTEKKVVTGWRCSGSCWTKGWRGTTSGCCCAGRRRTTWSGAGAGEAGVDYAAHEVQGRGVCPDEGRRGRHTPFFNGYRPQFYLRTTDVTGVATLPEGVEMVMPGTTWRSAWS